MSVFFRYQWDYTLAVGASLEIVRLHKRLTQLLVVVDLAVDGKGDVSVGTHKRLLACGMCAWCV
jgi:hypothetical protein